RSAGHISFWIEIREEFRLLELDRTRLVSGPCILTKAVRGCRAQGRQYTKEATENWPPERLHTLSQLHLSPQNIFHGTPALIVMFEFVVTGSSPGRICAKSSLLDQRRERRHSHW